MPPVPSLKRMCMASFARSIAQLPFDERLELEEQYKYHFGEVFVATGPFVGERVELDLSQKGYLRAGFDWCVIEEVGQKEDIRKQIQRYFDTPKSAHSRVVSLSLVVDVVSVNPETRIWALRGVSACERRVSGINSGSSKIQLPEGVGLFHLQNADNPSKSGINYRYVCDHATCGWCTMGAHPIVVKVGYERDYDGCPLLPYHVAQIWADGRTDTFPY